jgi:Probable sensor domain DACNV
VFPPALVPLLRERVMAKAGSLVEVADDVLVQLLTTIFWAGLETYEGERNPIGVAFLGTSGVDVVTSDVAGSDAPFLYQWKVQHFRSPRPFAVGELVKLAVAGADRRIYSAVNVMPDGSLVIAGLAREGFSVVSDPFVKIVTSRPGCLSIRSGRDSLLEYERGAILTGGDDLLFTAGLVRHALAETAHAADLDDDAVPDYVDAVRSLVREMAAHGRGGILIVSTEEWPEVAETATYRVAVDSSVASLLRLARRLGRTKRDESPQATDVAFGGLLRNAFLTEAERLTEELGALTGIDGAILLNRHLALVAFGVMLPLGRPTALAEAEDPEGLRARVVDLGSRGTRHHAGATYAAEHPGSVVFVASEDGHVSCMLRDALHERTLLWRLGPADVRTR